MILSQFQAKNIVKSAMPTEIPYNKIGFLVTRLFVLLPKHKNSFAVEEGQDRVELSEFFKISNNLKHDINRVLYFNKKSDILFVLQIEVMAWRYNHALARYFGLETTQMLISQI